jgi:hypothetical protein
LIKFSVLLYVAGVGSLYYYPNYAHKTYLSENALMPGNGLLDFSDRQMKLGVKLTSDFSAYQKEIQKTQT